MKTINLVLAIIIVFSANSLFAQKYIVNTDNSTVEWLGKKVGGEHFGFIELKSGSFEIADDKFVSGKFVIDMNSITCTDLEDEGYNKKLVGHLKSDDFFGVDKFPTAEFTITESSKFKDSFAIVKGKITIKGKTEDITFKAKKVGNNFGAVLLIDRSKFDVRYGSKSFFDNLGDKTIDDIFTLEVMLAVN